MGVYDKYEVFTKINPVHVLVVIEVDVWQKLNPEQLRVSARTANKKVMEVDFCQYHSS